MHFYDVQRHAVMGRTGLSQNRSKKGNLFGKLQKIEGTLERQVKLEKTLSEEVQIPEVVARVKKGWNRAKEAMGF